MGGVVRLIFLINVAHALRWPTPTSRSLLSSKKVKHSSQLLANGDTIGLSNEQDVVIIGSGLAGLSCAAILASSGISVTVLESHYEIGGCAHEFLYREDGTTVPSDRITEDESSNVYRFEAGPSLYSGLSTPRSPNPLKHVFQMIAEEPDWITYDVWTGFFPEAPEGFRQSIGARAFETTLQKYGGPTALDDWKKLSTALRPLTKGVMQLPTVAFRPDAGAFLTLLGRYPSSLFQTIILGRKLTAPFSKYYEELHIEDQFLKNYLNLLCFLLQGLPAEGTLSAVMAYMVEDFFRPNAVVDFPKGGSGAIAAALERGITKNGGKVIRRAHVERIIIENDRCVGVKVRGRDEAVRARKGVVCNTDMWTMYGLVPSGICEKFDDERKLLLETTPLCKSFVHLHIGIDSTGLPLDLPPQWTVCKDWSQPIDAPGNVIVVSMPSLLDPSLAPTGRHVIHAYTAGNEPYELWSKFKNDRRNPEYLRLKEERSLCLWEAIEKQIPDVRSRVKVQLVGTPLTHARYNRRYQGTYGPAIAAGKGTFPGQMTPLPGLYRCGDSTNPGIGVPAVAASGAMAANIFLPVWKHLALLDRIQM